MIAAFGLALMLAVASPNLQSHPCTQGKNKAAATCGSLRVFEDRAAKSGRMIDVHYIILKAQHPNGQVIYVNLGGPGSELGAVPALADNVFLNELKDLRKDYDILFVDERGFGLSGGIDCILAPVKHPDVYFKSLWASDILSDCHDRYVKTSDLSKYNTPNAVDDLNDLRAALGYKKLNFDVYSYGTFTALVYMRQHPESVGAAVLGGVAPPGIINQVREFAFGAKTGIANIAAQCAQQKGCNDAFPHFADHFAALVKKFDDGPLPVELQISPKDPPTTLQLSFEVFSDAVRHMLYDPQSQALVPIVIEHAYSGDTKPLAKIVELETLGFAEGIDAGAFLSYTCSEVMPFTDSAADVDAAQSSWYRDYRDRAQQAACKIWNVAAQPASFNVPVKSKANVLMISGTADSATPAHEGTEQLKFLPNGRQMLIAGANHDAESPCTDAAIVAFIRAGTAKGINLMKCSAHNAAPSFALELPKILVMP